MEVCTIRIEEDYEVSCSLDFSGVWILLQAVTEQQQEVAQVKMASIVCYCDTGLTSGNVAS